MVDKKTESEIKAVKSFLEVWMKFHSIYRDTILKEIISKDDEENFLETKAMVRNKYDDLRGGLEFKYIPHGRLTDPVGDILALEGIRFMAEKNLKRMNDDWKDSYVFLNNILERLKEKKTRMAHVNPVDAFFKKFFLTAVQKPNDGGDLK